MKKAIAAGSILALALGLGVACSPFASFRAYPGPKLPDPQLGVLYILVPEISIVEVDGKAVDFGPAEKKMVFFLPGRHTIGVTYYTSFRSWPVESRTFSGAPVFLTFEAEAGGRYWLQAEIGSSTWRPYIN